jgi:hypothetical protein
MIPSGLRARLSALFPGSTVTSVVALAPDAGTDETEKDIGYGQPLRVVVTDARGATRQLVFHVERPNDYGHDRRADRAADVLLAWDTFPLVPRHAKALDVGAITSAGELRPLGDADEFYLLTEWAEGEVYADDLRRVARLGRAEPLDVQRAEALAEVLADLHARRDVGPPAAYTRALRDLVGSGEGIAGIVDGYGDGAPGAPRARLDALERACLAWRQRLKHRAERLARTHGDFHPFNLVFAPGARAPTLLDTSRGSRGDPADDVTCLSINYLFFGLEHRASWSHGLGELWRAFWRSYLAKGDPGVLETAAPFFAWRALVVCNPQWYPKLPGDDRDRVLRFAERVLAAERFDPAWGEEAMR